MKMCASCKTSNADDARFCGQCMAPLQSPAGKTCPAGRHVMEPDWTECAYCRSDGSTVGPPPVSASAATAGYVRRPTVVEETGQSAAPAGTGTLQTPQYADDRPLPPRPTPRPFKPVPVAPPPPPLSRPIVPPPSPQLIPRKTVYRPEPQSGSAILQPPPVLAQRRIVGMLVSYSWKPDGEIFPIREGRNLIGRDPDCEVCISADQTMSGRNSHITFRATFVVGDLVSMKGTDLNGDPIEQQFLSLPNYSIIRAGSTQFTFIAIQPPADRENP